jgi:hypothetical protein
MAMTHPGNNVLDSIGGGKMKFQIGDRVREGMHVGTVMDVGTMLIQVKTNEGRSRVVCPWELVRVRVSHDGIGANLALE